MSGTLAVAPGRLTAVLPHGALYLAGYYPKHREMVAYQEQLWPEEVLVGAEPS